MRITPVSILLCTTNEKLNTKAYLMCIVLSFEYKVSCIVQHVTSEIDAKMDFHGKGTVHRTIMRNSKTAILTSYPIVLDVSEPAKYSAKN